MEHSSSSSHPFPSSYSPENGSVKVALHVRPLVGDEISRGCKECVSVTPGMPQVQIGTHSFTFDHVYGSCDSPPSLMFEECIASLIDGLLQGYNATVLAYGQTGSGKTYTMGTAFNDGNQRGLIPQVMNTLFSKIETVKHQMDFQLHVSFIEILNKEVRDLLDDGARANKLAKEQHGKLVSGKSPVQIRESSKGVITLSGATEVSVTTQEEMAACLGQGSLIRATGSTNMNNQSSRSHAIFTITLHQMRRVHSVSGDKYNLDAKMGEELLCAKLHLVDLAGSERAKRTGSGGARLKEGIHINKGLLALGNVISALGDVKKRKEGAHIPYRDSKLTRLLQDSLGGNSKTVMIACISPADINAEETLNTLKYANRARNIRNKPVANIDVISNEIQRLHQQIEYLQAALCARGEPPSNELLQVLRQRIRRLEATNEELSQELHLHHSKQAAIECFDIDAQESGDICVKDYRLKRGFQSLDSLEYEMSVTASGGKSRDIASTREWEHKIRQNNFVLELDELRRHLERKESDMKTYREVGIETEAVKQHSEKKIIELEKEKRVVMVERDRLISEVEALVVTSERQEGHAWEDQVELLKEKQRSEEAAKRLQAEIQCIKAQKVQLQQRMKQEAEQYRQWKAFRDEGLLQLKKEGRRVEHEILKLESLNQCQKTVLQRKAEEAAMTTKRLKEVLEACKSSPRDVSVNIDGQQPTEQMNRKTLQKWVDNELEVTVKVHQVRLQYDRQAKVRAALAEELTSLTQEMELASSISSPRQLKHEQSRFLSTNARLERIASLENMLDMSTNAVTALAARIPEAEDKEKGGTRWNQIRSMADAKPLLQYIFSTAAEARLWEKDRDMKKMEEKLDELDCALRLSEIQRREILKEQTVSIALAASSLVSSYCSSKHYSDDTVSGTLSPTSLPASKHLRFEPGTVHVSARDSDRTTKSSGRSWRWKRSRHHQWFLQFKWKWQKPWKLSEWTKHSDETIMRFKPHPKSTTASCSIH